MNSLENVTVLYVDDEPNNLFLFEASFRRAFKVITSSSPLEGLKKLDENPNEIIAIVSDMRMPEMTGIEFIKEARKKYASKFYFILTGFDYDQEINEAMNQKIIHSYFKKPFDADQIEETIKEVLAN